MKKQYISTLLGMLLIVAGTSAVVNAASPEDITGTFDPTTSMVANLWNSTLEWGNLAVGANISKTSQLNNTGDVAIDSTIYNDTYSGGLTLVAVADLNAEDEFACIFDSVDSSWIDMGTIASPATLDDNIAALTGTSPFDVNIKAPPSYSIDHAQQSFNLKVAYVIHT